MKLGIGVAMSIFVWAVSAVLVLDVIGATGSVCPSDANCICGGRPAVELKCNIDGKEVSINVLPNTYLNIKCGHASYINYDKIPRLSANEIGVLKSVTFKDCPLPKTSFKDVLNNIGVSKTMSLIFQNSKNLTRYLDRTQFEGLQDLTKLLLSVSSTTHIPDNLFIDMQNLTWLNIRSNGNNLSRKLFEPLEKLETLEISHNGKTNITSNVFSHLTLLRKLSLWQSNVTRFSEDLFNGVEVLEELDLSSNGLNELPSSIFNPLKKLKKLTLFSNKFSTLPADLFRNNLDLDTVIIFNNDVKLKTLPKGLFKAKSNLNEVYIQRCALEDIPKDLFSNSPKISNISLAYNEIEVLPEAIFNDQINLLDLDLSHNKIKELEPKIFSSLVRLERLKLSHNSLQVISGSTFSSLLSLEYLNIANNKLRTITSMLFSNNKQRMTIIMSHNQLDFENIVTEGIDINLKISPFGDITKMKLLDLSHNALKDTYDDWWFNGHESLDISYNNITRLQRCIKKYERAIKGKTGEICQKTLKQIWISHNPLVCNCQNAFFLTKLMEWKTKGASINQLNCNYFQITFCREANISFFFLFPILGTVFLFSVIAVIGHRRQIYESIKFILYDVHGSHNNDQSAKYLIINYTHEDKEFVLEKLLPGLNTCNKHQLSFIMKPISSFGKKKIIGKAIRNFIKTSNDDVSLVLLTPTFLMAAYQDINIKKIQHEISKNKRAIFIFADIGPEDSLLTYLKEESDPRYSIIWGKANFWDILSNMINARVYKVCEQYKSYTVPIPIYSKECFGGIDRSCDQGRDNRQSSDFHTLAHSKV